MYYNIYFYTYSESSLEMDTGYFSHLGIIFYAEILPVKMNKYTLNPPFM